VSSEVLDSLFRDTTVVLAGATGQLGRRIGERILAAGGRLGLPVRRASDVERARAMFANGGILPVVVEPADGEAAAGMCKGVVDALGPVTALICAQGAFEPGPLHEERGPRLMRMLEANLVYSYTLVRALAPVFRTRKNGRIVLVGSRSALRGAAGMAAYNAAKGGLHALACSLAEELAPDGIAVNLVAPSVIDTPRNRRSMPGVEPAQWATVDDVADSVLFLASPLARRLRGSILVPSGPGP
jgi:NAD(P)-dependent dehydrogenase (short-subunit alcohol dehydrogenase family)